MKLTSLLVLSAKFAIVLHTDRLPSIKPQSWQMMKDVQNNHSHLEVVNISINPACHALAVYELAPVVQWRAEPLDVICKALALVQSTGHLPENFHCPAVDEVGLKTGSPFVYCIAPTSQYQLVGQSDRLKQRTYISFGFLQREE